MLRILVFRKASARTRRIMFFDWGDVAGGYPFDGGDEHTEEIPHRERCRWAI